LHDPPFSFEHNFRSFFNFHVQLYHTKGKTQIFFCLFSHGAIA